MCEFQHINKIIKMVTIQPLAIIPVRKTNDKPHKIPIAHKTIIEILDNQIT